MKVEIDNNSGFCFGVVKGVEKAEQELKENEKLYCLGEIVHNQEEVKRLEHLGLITINHTQLINLNNCKVLIRAHGEPPETYELAKKNNIELIDATCPVVLKLQQRIRKSYNEISAKDGQLVIYGKEGHAEVVGLVGQTGNKAVVVKDAGDIEKINLKKPIRMFSQTTMSMNGFEEMKNAIEKKIHLTQNNKEVDFVAKNTVCRSVSCREPALKEFALTHDVVLFVSGKNSSNGKMLFEVCKKANNKSYFISSISDLKKEWIKNADSVGVCGATSTPLWLMKQVAENVENEYLC